VQAVNMIGSSVDWEQFCVVHINMNILFVKKTGGKQKIKMQGPTKYS